MGRDCERTGKQKVGSGVFWRMIQRFGIQAMGFVVSIILARLQEPQDFKLLGSLMLLCQFRPMSMRI
jgi:O-antigen/teichoic acid export membrane protein